MLSEEISRFFFPWILFLYFSLFSFHFWFHVRLSICYVICGCTFYFSTLHPKRLCKSFLLKNCKSGRQGLFLFFLSSSCLLLTETRVMYTSFSSSYFFVGHFHFQFVICLFLPSLFSLKLGEEAEPLIDTRRFNELPSPSSSLTGLQNRVVRFILFSLPLPVHKDQEDIFVQGSREERCFLRCFQHSLFSSLHCIFRGESPVGSTRFLYVLKWLMARRRGGGGGKRKEEYQPKGKERCERKQCSRVAPSHSRRRREFEGRERQTDSQTSKWPSSLVPVTLPLLYSCYTLKYAERKLLYSWAHVRESWKREDRSHKKIVHERETLHLRTKELKNTKIPDNEGTTGFHFKGQVKTEAFAG